MAVTVLNAWTALADSDPNGVQTISAGSERLAVLFYACENGSQIVFSQMEIGGVASTGSSLTYWDNGSADQHAYFYWWNEAAIASFADNDIDSEDSQVPAKQGWNFGVYAGVNQATPVTEENSGTNASTDQISLTTTSTSDEYDVVGVSRSSANRDITSWGTLVEQSQSNVAGEFTAGIAHDVGGVSPIVIDGDGIAADITYGHIIIHASGGLSDVNFQGSHRGIMRGIGRGIG